MTTRTLWACWAGGRDTGILRSEDEVDWIANTVSKALASLGSCISSKAVAMNYVRHKSRPFIFSAAFSKPGCRCPDGAGDPQRKPMARDPYNEIAAYMKKKLSAL